MIYDMIW